MPKNFLICCLCLVASLYFINCFYGFEGYDGYDDISYLRHAYLLPQKSWADIFNYPHEQAQRLGFILPLSWCLQVVGLDDTSIQLAMVCIALLGWICVYFFVQKATQNQFTAFLCTFLLGTDYYYWYMSNKVYPDTLTTVAVIFALGWLYQSENQLVTKKYFTLFAISLFVAFLNKLTVAFISFFLVYRVVVALRSKNQELLIFWYSNFFVGFLLLMTYLIAYQYFTQDAFFRFSQIEAHRYADALSYFDKDFTVLLQRLTYQPLIMFVKVGYIVNFIFALPLMVQFRVWNRTESFWCMALWASLAFYWWGSTSWQTYSPMPLDYRMAIVLSPIMAVTAGLAVQKSLQKVHYQVFYTLAFTVIGLAAYQFLYLPKGIFYCLIGLFWGAYSLLATHSTLKYYSSKIVFFLLFLLIIPIIYTLHKTDNKTYSAEKQVLQTYIKQRPDSLVVYTDSRLVGQIDFYYDFNPNPKHIYHSFDTLSTPPPATHLPTYLLLNTKTIRYLAAYTGRQFPTWLFDRNTYDTVAHYQGISLLKLP